MKLKTYAIKIWDEEGRHHYVMTQSSQRPEVEGPKKAVGRGR